MDKKVSELELSGQGLGRDLPLHPAMELLLARLESDPDWAETYFSIAYKYRNSFTREERHALNLKKREHEMKKFHVDIMTQVLKPKK